MKRWVWILAGAVFLAAGMAMASQEPSSSLIVLQPVIEENPSTVSSVSEDYASHTIAQFPQSRRSGPTSGPTSGFSSSQRPLSQEQFQIMMAAQMVNYLGLSESQSAQFFPALREYNRTRDDLFRKRGEIVAKISKDADNKSVTTETLRTYTRELARIGSLDTKNTQDYWRKAEKILDDRQYAKLLIFEDKLREGFVEQYRQNR